MARPLRLEYPGAVWMVKSEGNERKPIFRDDEDRTMYLEILRRVVEMFRWKLQAWVLMNRHFALLVETPEPNLSRGMRQLNGIYTQWFNRRHNRSGSLMHGRFKSVLVEKDTKLVDVARYMALEPVRAGLAATAGVYPWCSYKMTAGLVDEPNWMDDQLILSHFGKSRRQAQEKYRKFVTDPTGLKSNPLNEVVGQIFLGTPGFRDSVMHSIKPNGKGAKLSIARPKVKSIAEAVAAEFGTTIPDMRKKRRGPARKALALLARREAAAKLADIGSVLGIADWSVSTLASAAEHLAEKDKGFRQHVERVAARLQH